MAAVQAARRRGKSAVLPASEHVWLLHCCNPCRLEGILVLQLYLHRFCSHRSCLPTFLPLQDFIGEMGGYYELVIFTDSPATYAEPIISKLDPTRCVLYRLYRPETQYHNGKHVRDLSKLNRDLSQV